MLAFCRRFAFLPKSHLWLLGILVLTGCSKQGTATSTVDETGAQSASEAEAKGHDATAASPKQPAPARSTGPITASGVLDAMVSAYRQATSYADAGQIEVHAVFGDQKIDEKAPCSVTFVRPNRLRLHMYQGNLLSDGRQIRGWIDTQTPQEPFAGQILSLDTPAKLTMESVYADDVLTGYLTQGIAGSSLQLLLLLGDDPLKEIQADAERPVLLEPAAIDNQTCRRVLLARADGKLVLWVDQATHVLRRVELPTDQFRQHLSQQGEVKELSVSMELTGAVLNGKVDDTAFKLEMPANARLVKEFDRRELLPPPPAAPPLLGKAAPDFVVKDLNGKEISAKSLSGKIAVLDFWFTTCPPCREGLPRLEQVYQAFRDNSQIKFIAVSVDPAEIGNEKLSEMFSELKITIPIARDAEQQAMQTLGITGCPTTIILDADGVVQDFEAGANPEVAATLPAKLKKLLAGESVHPQVLAEYQRRLAEYEQSLKEPQVQKAEIAERSEPKRLTIERRFQSTELKQPGNVLTVETKSGEPLILINDGWRHVAELSPDGSTTARHELAVPEDEVVATLRTGIGQDGKRYYLGLATSQKQVHLFDDRWQHLMSYPADRDHAGIADALLADLDGDGQLELNVSYWGVVGVQGASLDGKRLWSNRSMEHVFRLAVTGANAKGQRQLLCANGTGALVSVDFEGQNSKPISVGSHFLRAVYSADLNHDGEPEWLGLASTNSGSDIAVAFNTAGEELWTYPLPKGVQEHPTLEMVTFGKLTGGNAQWVLAGADGSIHIMTADGELIDQFNYGSALTGLAVTQLDGRPALIIATPQGVEGWEVKSK